MSGLFKKLRELTQSVHIDRAQMLMFSSTQHRLIKELVFNIMNRLPVPRLQIPYQNVALMKPL